MSYEKFYPGGWQSGESGGTPITPEALNHIENGIKQTYSDFAPAQEDVSFPGCYYRMVNGIKEWINPPMALGVEYRTTEQWQGHAVYAKMVDLGTLPNSTVKSVEHNVFCTNIIRFSGAKSDGTGLPYDDGTICVRLSATLYYIKVFTNIDLSDQTGMATIYYVK